MANHLQAPDLARSDGPTNLLLFRLLQFNTKALDIIALIAVVLKWSDYLDDDDSNSLRILTHRKSWLYGQCVPGISKNCLHSQIMPGMTGSIALVT